jgi:hypothetical protein
LSSDKIVIEIDRDIYRLCLVCIAFLFLPIFFLFVLPSTAIFGWYSPVSLLVVWPLTVIVILYCFSRWESEPSSDRTSPRNHHGLISEE